MAGERLFADVLQELRDAKKTGALYVSMVETSEDLVRIYFRNGDIYHLRYGSAVGKDCLDILEYYNFWSATFFDGILAPGGAVSDLPETARLIALLRDLKKTVKVK
jgi:hypothetical protein